jgi:hypothetical protein
MSNEYGETITYKPYAPGCDVSFDRIILDHPDYPLLISLLGDWAYVDRENIQHITMWNKDRGKVRVFCVQDLLWVKEAWVKYVQSRSMNENRIFT